MKERESHIFLQKEKDWQSFKGIFFVPGINTFADDCTTYTTILHNSCTQYSHGLDIPGGRRVFFFLSFFYQNVTAMIDMHPVRMYTFL